MTKMANFTMSKIVLILLLLLTFLITSIFEPLYFAKMGPFFFKISDKPSPFSVKSSEFYIPNCDTEKATTEVMLLYINNRGIFP